MNAPMQDRSQKISRLHGETALPFSHDRIYAAPSSEHPNAPVVFGIADGDADIFRHLVRATQAPYFLLYVLHTPRGEAAPGRYQSPELGAEDIDGFLRRFRGYLAADARFDVWVHSIEERATIVWDRHNLGHAYGDRERFVAALKTMQYRPGQPSIDFAHLHHYRQACDEDAAAVVAMFEWRYSPLRPEDEQ